MNQKARNFVLSILVVLASLNFLAWIAVFDLSKPQFLEVNFFDVGQGDAIFIQTPKRNQILIDGGQSSVILEKLGKEMPFWDRSIDLIILTHPERDHLVGLLEVFKKYKVENIFWTGIKRDIPEYQEWQKLIKKERAKIYIIPFVQKVTIGKDISMNFLYPIENLADKEYQNSNDTSIVAKLNFNQNSFLFTGDISKSVEEELINYYQNLKSDVLKVAHHGSKTSTSEEFLKKILPKIAVIMVGKENPYGHPHQEVLEILNKFGIRVLRTDENGDVKIISDGQKLKIK
jgi:competence protein ComEC